MFLLLDTCAVIWTGNQDAIKKDAEVAIDEAAQSRGVLVSSVSAWEIGLAAKRRKSPLNLRPDLETWWQTLVSQPGIGIVSLDVGAALGASMLPPGLSNDPADRLLVAQARAMDVPIVTRDRRILDYAGRGHVRALAC
jgi:PIN domain nuclease of toxin-antitoxin system